MVNLLAPMPTALARASEALPDVAALAGGARFEPKWDGARVTAHHAGGEVALWSRRAADLTGAFPELVKAARALPEGTVLDGEVVTWVDGRLDFDVLLSRLSLGRQRAAVAAREHPASLVVFDVLAARGTDLRDRGYDQRRRELEHLARDWAPPLSVSPMTRDRDVAVGWIRDMADAGIEGVVVKGGSQTYRGGERQWVKVKRHDTVDVVIGAVIGPITRPRQVVVGDVVGGRLVVTGRSAPLSAAQSASLGALLEPPAGLHPWPETIGQGRFGHGEPTRVTLVEPVVGEVVADSARVDGGFRHLVRFRRLRSPLESGPEG
jgi:hypothetical protein